MPTLAEYPTFTSASLLTHQDTVKRGGAEIKMNLHLNQPGMCAKKSDQGFYFPHCLNQSFDVI